MRHAICALVVLGACTSVEESECGPLVPGVYRFRLQEQSGDCGGGEGIVNITAENAAAFADCEGTRTPIDACSTAIDVRCPIMDPATGRPSGTARYVGRIDSMTTTASGTLDVAAADLSGGNGCQSIYTATWEPI